MERKDTLLFSWYPLLSFTHLPSSPPVPGPPLGLEGEAVGSNGILLSWTMPLDADNIDGYVIRWFFDVFCDSVFILVYLHLKFTIQESFIVFVYDKKIAICAESSWDHESIK